MMVCLLCGPCVTQCLPPCPGRDLDCVSCFNNLAGAPVQPVVAAYPGCAAVPPHTMSPTAGICVDCMLGFLERSGGAARLEWTIEEAARRGPGAPPPRQDAAAQCPACKQLAEEAYWASQFARARAAAREAWDASAALEAAAAPADPLAVAEPWRAGWVAAAGVLELGEDAIARGAPLEVPAGAGGATFAGLLAALLSATLALHRQGYIQAQARVAFRGDA